MNNTDRQKGFIWILSIPLTLVFLLGILLLATRSTFLSDILLSKKTKPQKEQMEFQKGVLTPIGISYLKDGDIWLADVDGKNSRQVTTEGGIDDYTWDGSGQKLVYRRLIINKPKTIAEIKLYDAERGESEIIHNKTIETGELGEVGLHYSFDFGFSPDGTRIAYSGNFLEAHSKASLVVYDIHTKTKKEFFDPAMQPTFSPLGSELVRIYQSSVDIYNLITGNTQTIKIQNATRLKNDVEETAYDVLAWSNDQKGILYYFGNYGKGSDWSNSTQHIYYLNANTTLSRQVTPSGMGQIDWYLGQSEDGHEVYYLVFDQKFYSYLLKKANMITNEEKQIELPQGLILSGSDLDFSVSSGINKILIGYPGFGVWIMDSTGQKSEMLFVNASKPKWVY